MLPSKHTVEPWVRSDPLSWTPLLGFTNSIVQDVNRKDYRAWYGLGQAYELLSMHHYALHYYQHATALR
jgi:hypothetical protein